MSVTGLRFADAWRRRVTTDFDGVPAPVLSRDDLLINKRAAGRPQDLVDVSHLEEAERIAKEALKKPQASKERSKVRPRKRRKT
jgi:hypothetical protein